MNILPDIRDMDNQIRYELTLDGEDITIMEYDIANLELEFILLSITHSHAFTIDHVTAWNEFKAVYEHSRMTAINDMQEMYLTDNLSEIPANMLRFDVTIDEEEYTFLGTTLEDIRIKLKKFCTVTERSCPSEFRTFYEAHIQLGAGLPTFEMTVNGVLQVFTGSSAVDVIHQVSRFCRQNGITVPFVEMEMLHDKYPVSGVPAVYVHVAPDPTYGTPFIAGADDMCPICLNVESKYRWLQLPCGHPMHARCIRKWHKQHASCPLCRAAV